MSSADLASKSDAPASGAAAEMTYLTTHDLIWINTVVTGETNPYNYVDLEAAMAGQYRYGSSRDVPAQAAQMLRRLVQYRPFAKGNLATALIATLTFLNANGYATVVEDDEAAEILIAVEEGRLDPLTAVQRLGTPAREALQGVGLRRLITHECNLHVEALRILSERENATR